MADESFTDKFIESLHQAEVDRKDKHESMDGFLLAVLSVLGSVGLYYLKILPPSLGPWYTYYYAVCCTLFAIFFGAATYCTAWSVWPRPIAYLKPKDLFDYSINLRPFYGFDEQDDKKVDEMIDREMCRVARSHYAKCAAHNREINFDRQVWQTRARQFVTGMILLLLINAPATYFIQQAFVEEQAVRITSYPPGPEKKEISNDRTAIPAAGTGKPSPKSEPGATPASANRANN